MEAWADLAHMGEFLVQGDLLVLSAESAPQQPEWPDRRHVRVVREVLAGRPPLVRADEVHALRSQVARAAAGELLVVQAGDCAEDPAECVPGHLCRKIALLDVLAGVLNTTTGKPVLRVGRIAGQFGKPRSRATERVDGLDLPVYRGHMVNSPEPDPLLRLPDPERLLAGHDAASAAAGYLRLRNSERLPSAQSWVWTSHEALLLDYELPMLRQTDEGGRLLASTHWPWIGNRTNQVDGAHTALLATVSNPVSCKVGPTMTPQELVALCERLDPFRAPGRLTLISRMGAAVVAERLPPLVAAVREAGHPVGWLVDPMHGNTVSGPHGLKTRFVDTVVQEVVEFQRAVAVGRGVAVGLHLETTPDDVTECVANASAIDRVGDKFTSLCDPRLNPEQAVEVVSSWR